jgi:hypothetical protein
VGVGLVEGVMQALLSVHQSEVQAQEKVVAGFSPHHHPPCHKHCIVRVLNHEDLESAFSSRSPMRIDANQHKVSFCQVVPVIGAYHA